MSTDYSETPESLLEELHKAYLRYPDLEAVYRGYASVFNKVLVFNTQFCAIKFKGAYAKTAYLLKEHRADAQLTKAVNALRVRISKAQSAFLVQSAECRVQSAEPLPYERDYNTLCQFIALVYNLVQSAECLNSAECRVQSAELAAHNENTAQTHSALCTLHSALKEDSALCTLHSALKEDSALCTLHSALPLARLLVKSWDERYIYGTVDGIDEPVTVSYSHCFQGKEDLSWRYIKDYLTEGCQLNLVRVMEKDGILVPELIIYEPDYLINISDIAACFQEYAVSPLIYLVKKLQPSQHTEATLLGNFASQLLDEYINFEDEEAPYAESVKRFFKDNAFNLLAAKVSPDFHRNARQQMANIRNTFAELPKAISAYDRKKAVLEPSFLSPMLGLQGRVDLMQQDFRFLVEQKSGKSRFPAPTKPDDAPAAVEQHYVQLLLYMMIMRYNYRDIYEKNRRQLHSFLLYSRYPTSLCGVDFAPELMFKALSVRNAIVHAEEGYANGGFHILDTLQPADFLQKPVARIFWEHYLCPQLSAVLDPVHQATPLERKYFHRMLAFIANEHLLAKVGSNQRDGSGMAATWNTTLDEKRQTGNIFTDLTLVQSAECRVQSRAAQGHSALCTLHSALRRHSALTTDITLRYEQRADSGMCNFRNGDIVILYPYYRGQAPDATRRMVIRGTLTDISSNSISIHLRAPQSNDRLFANADGDLWAVEHDFMEATFTSQYRSIHAFLTAPKERRDLLLFQREPRVDETITETKGDYGSFNTLALRVKQARDIFLIIGPPGTGKTSFGMLNTLKEQLLEEGTTVLVTAYTNRAVDEICSKLVEEGISFLRLGSPVSAEKAYHKYMLDHWVDECQNLAQLEEYVRGVRVVVGTTTTLAGKQALFSLKTFDLMIVDEASQILEPHILPLLCAKNNGEAAVKKMVMIGDHKQLPAVVKQSEEEARVDDADLNAIHLTDCRLSLFERLLRQYAGNPHLVYMLTAQGRMHEDIAQFPSQAFYESRLTVVPLPHQTAESRQPRVRFIDVPLPSDEQYRRDKINLPEAEVMAQTVVEIYKKRQESFDVNQTVGVIVPYRNQILAVRTAIDNYGIPVLHDITIDTVERYQGSQRDYIIYGFTVQRRYQLQFLTSQTFEENGATIDRKLNVAMTRAREHLIMTGNKALLSEVPIFRQLIEYVGE